MSPEAAENNTGPATVHESLATVKQFPHQWLTVGYDSNFHQQQYRGSYHPSPFIAKPLECWKLLSRYVPFVLIRSARPFSLCFAVPLIED
jgi:hypothetical protein